MADHGQSALAPMPPNDGSAAPAPFDLPEHYFRARCQNPACHALLGGFHVPVVGGMVAYACAHCGRSTIFRIEGHDIKSRIIGPLKGTKFCPPTSVRKRQGKG